MLEHYTVLEVGDYVAVPYAGKLLGDCGADVIKVEPPDGDSARRVPPFVDGDGRSESASFGYLNTSKRSVTLSPSSDRAPELLEDAIETLEIDLVLESRLDDYGIDGRTLQERDDGLTVVSVSGFGSDGPFAEFSGPEIVAMAESGQMNKMGYPDEPPLRPRVKSADFWAGQHAAIGGLAALLVRDLQNGCGQYVDVAARDVAITYMEGFLAGYSWSGEPTERTGLGYPDQDGQPGLPALYEAADGYVSAAVSDARWDAFCEDVLERPELTEDDRFATPEARLENLPAMREVVESYTGQRGKWELFEEFQDNGIPCGIVQTPTELLEFEHLRERGFWTDLELPNGETVTVPGSPFRVDGSQLPMDAPPALGEDNDLYDELGLDRDRLAASGVIR
ncbi:CaiB/BaiF CoA transferase family protein [Natrarchaeobius oligotrophus]|uniref:CoA transferase n=1 Tax=Natrarchaeobius chitinivorans TaxID=1679083 RepID=A0A3N6MLT7_NATCH|nr:CoA transferase [Natrarchaeobius chitinivorans]RQH02475.1 CoA transferase [Natrarchaeobius chitinivorans]